LAIIFGWEFPLKIQHLSVILLLVGCVTVDKSVLLDRSAYPVPMSAVQVLIESDTVPEDCQRVAMLHAEGPEIFTSEADMWDSLREETGELGGNTVQLLFMGGPDWAERFLRENPDRDATAIALWCPM
jgi:hypothetical protein